MGMGATNVFGRVLASLGLVRGVSTEFIVCADVANGGVLFCIPALISNGLLHDLDEHFQLPLGYYTLQQIFLLVAFLALCRIKCFEQLRYSSPGEWGKVIGLDRIPEVRTLRGKIGLLSEQGRVQQWSMQLCREWMEEAPGSAGVLYIDGHVRVYHGSKTVLPRHYVARQRLCLRATVDYWINAIDGKPFFRINQAVDPGLLAVLRNEIIPTLEKDIPGQPSLEELHENPLLHRFTIVIDREGYSPDFFLELKEKRIAVITYHKFPDKDWPEEEFVEYTNKTSDGSLLTQRLAERGTCLRNQLWVREIRKLTESGHQTTLLSTDFMTGASSIAIELFSRWSQENFFKYMREQYNLDRLVEYQTEPIPDTTQVINPAWRECDTKIRSASSTLSRQLKEFGAIHIIGEIEPENMEQFQRQKAQLQQHITALQEKILQIKTERAQLKKHISIKELPEDQRFDRLSTESKHLVDTIKLIAYRAETSLACSIKEYLTDPEDARSLIKNICLSHADIIPDKTSKTLTIQLHHLASQTLDNAVQKLCDELNATEIIFPGTEMKLVYKLT